MNILITGNKGMLGARLTIFLQEKGHKVFGYDLPENDLLDQTRLENKINSEKIEFIYNCAAYTNVDGCETNYDTAYSVNAIAVKYLAEKAKKYNIPLVHISTDFIFSGEAEDPYTIDAKPAPLSAYGKTKLAGEQFVRQIWPQKSFIIRTAWLYGLKSRNFVETIIKFAGEKPELKIVDDQRGAPTFADDLAAFLTLLTDSQKYGVYHYTNQGQVSRYDFAKYFLGRLGYNTKLTACKTADFPRPAKVPAYSVLDLTKTEKEFKINIPVWQDGLDRYLRIRESK